MGNVVLCGVDENLFWGGLRGWVVSEMDIDPYFF